MGRKKERQTSYERVAPEFHGAIAGSITEMKPSKPTSIHYIMPVKAHIYLYSVQGKGWADKSIAYSVLHRPGSTPIIKSGGKTERGSRIRSFPQSGPHEVKTDGSFLPSNLPEIIVERLNNGWTIDYEDAGRLGLLPVYEKSD